VRRVEWGGGVVVGDLLQCSVGSHYFYVAQLIEIERFKVAEAVRTLEGYPFF